MFSSIERITCNRVARLFLIRHFVASVLGFAFFGLATVMNEEGQYYVIDTFDSLNAPNYMGMLAVLALVTLFLYRAVHPSSPGDDLPRYFFRMPARICFEGASYLAGGYLAMSVCAAIFWNHDGAFREALFGAIVLPIFALMGPVIYRGLWVVTSGHSDGEIRKMMSSMFFASCALAYFHLKALF